MVDGSWTVSEVGEGNRDRGDSDEGVASVSVSLIASRLPTFSSLSSSPLLPQIHSTRVHFAANITASSLDVSEVVPDIEGLLRSHKPLIYPLFVAP